MENKKEQIKNKFISWVKEVIVPYNKTLGFAACPFAKSLLKKGNYSFHVCEEGKDIKTFIENVLDNWDDDNEIVMIVIEGKEEHLFEIKSVINNKYKEKDLYLLVDCPSKPFILQGINITYPHNQIAFIQRLNSLIKASDLLKEKGYYDNWEEHNYQEVVLDRLKLYNEL